LRRDPIPKYIQIKNSIIEQITGGDLGPGEQIHSISEIMEKFKVSKVTAVRALTELEVEGIVQRKHGLGTFVAHPKEETSEARARKSVTVIAPDMANPFHIEVVGCVERRLREEGIVVELSCTDYQVEVEKRLIRTVVSEKHVSGIVLISSAIPRTLYHEPLPDIPLVMVDACPSDLIGKCVFITCDNFKGGYDAAAHLAHLGHKRIGYVNIPIGSLDRLSGFRKGMEDHDLILEEGRILMLSSRNQVGSELIDFVKRENLTALFTVNDMIAMQAMHLLRSHGFRIPEDISLVGYDNVAAARYLEVPLTTIEQYEEQIGRKAAENLLAGLNPANSSFRPREIVIVPRLIVRASTAPPRR